MCGKICCSRSRLRKGNFAFRFRDKKASPTRRVAHRKFRKFSEANFSEIFRKFRVTPLENRNIGNRVSNLPEELW